MKSILSFDSSLFAIAVPPEDSDKTIVPLKVLAVNLKNEKRYI
jgi:hypothetical protein